MRSSAPTRIALPYFCRTAEPPSSLASGDGPAAHETQDAVESAQRFSLVEIPLLVAALALGQILWPKETRSAWGLLICRAFDSGRLADV